MMVQKKSSLLNNILYFRTEHKKLFFLAMYPSVYTLFFTTNSPVEICICTFSFRKVSLVYLPPSFSYTIFSLTLCATVLVVVSFFFVMCIRRTKKSFTHKKERVFSALHKFRLLDHWYLFFPPPPPPSSLSFSLSLQSSEVSTMLFLLLLLLLSSTPQRPKAREFFVFSFLCALLFFRIF